jgi:hypothetical protein
MAKDPKRHRIRVRGHQRDDIDLDLLVQALIQIGEERARAQQEAEPDGDKPLPRSGTADVA